MAGEFLAGNKSLCYFGQINNKTLVKSKKGQ